MAKLFKREKPALLEAFIECPWGLPTGFERVLERRYSELNSIEELQEAAQTVAADLYPQYELSSNFRIDDSGFARFRLGLPLRNEESTAVSSSIAESEKRDIPLEILYHDDLWPRAVFPLKVENEWFSARTIAGYRNFSIAKVRLSSEPQHFGVDHTRGVLDGAYWAPNKIPALNIWQEAKGSQLRWKSAETLVTPLTPGAPELALAPLELGA